MIMKIKLTAVFLLINMSMSYYHAQGVFNRWKVIIEDDIKTISLDTASVSLLGRQISFWILEEYKKVEKFSENKSEVKKVKSQYLINPATLRYSVIGRLFYDETGKVIGESATPGLSGGGENFYISIESNSLEEFLLNSASAFLKDDSGNLTRSIELHSQNKVHKNEDTLSLSEMNQNSGRIDPETKGRERIGNNETDENKNSNKVPAGEYEEIKDKNSANELSSQNINAPNDTTSMKSAEYEYNVGKEWNVTSTIFTDGEKFCFQVSSWRTKTIADQEAERLRRSGHNAYVVAARPDNKENIWYRVRIGYFSTLDDAKKAEGKVN